MSANNTQNQEVYDRVKIAMLQDGAIPKEIIEHEQKSIEIKRMQQKQVQALEDQAGTIDNISQAFTQKYPSLEPIRTPIKIIVKRAEMLFTTIDYALTYQINGGEGVVVKIGEEVISNVVFAAGTSVSIAISSAVATFISGLSGNPQFGVVVGFFVFSGGVIASDWLGDKSKYVVNLFYEHIYLPIKNKARDLKNGLNYFINGGFKENFYLTMI